MIVVDSSVVVAALADAGSVGDWAGAVVAGQGPHAPPIVLPEVANVLRRQQLAGRLEPNAASAAHANLLRLGITLVPYEAVADRVWHLRHQVTAYDACYVALAELLDVELATLDHRLSRAHGVTCSFRLPPPAPS